jgi:hypothetical protein
MSEVNIISGCVVLIEGFDDIPAHQFLVYEVFDGFITGKALTGPLAGEYGEPEMILVVEVLSVSRKGLQD